MPLVFARRLAYIVCMEHIDICIVGAGPAGIATAAALIKQRPGLRERILVLEKFQHPRHKLCGGGLTPWVDQTLRELELEADVPAFQVKCVLIFFNDRPLRFELPGLMRTVRRHEFDAALAESLKRKGVRIIENAAVREATRQKNGILVKTGAGDFFARILVGADGAKSVIRRQFFRQSISRVSRLIEVLAPVNGGAHKLFEQQTALIDFRPMRAGLQGYMWDFPCWHEGRPFFNIGLFDSRIHDETDLPRADLPELLQRHLAEQGYDSETAIMGHPERWHHSADAFSAPHVLLAGEAAGIEPWLGEGISAAMAYGPLAAEAIIHALEAKDFSFADYCLRIRSHRLGKFLRRNRLIAKLFYHRHFRTLLPLFGRMLQGYMRLKQ